MADILMFALVLVGGYIVIRILTRIIRKVLDRRLSHIASGFITLVSKVMLYLIYGISLLAILGVPTTSLIAILSAFSLAVTLALQGSLSNLAGGVQLIANKPFEQGDYVDIGGTAGTVKEITIASTVLITPDNNVVTIPNATVATSEVINYNTTPQRRLDLTIPVAYGTDPEQVKPLLRGLVEAHPNVLPDRGITVRLKTLGSSSLDFAVRAWVNNKDYWDTYFDLNESIVAALGKAGIQIPFNQLDVHLIREGGESHADH